MGPALGGLSMKTISSAVMSAAVLSALACLTPASAMDEHKVLTPNDVKWGPAPASVPKGAQAAGIYGDPSKEGLFALRLKLPKGYHIPPHTHPKPELVTVLSGTALSLLQRSLRPPVGSPRTVRLPCFAMIA